MDDKQIPGEILFTLDDLQKINETALSGLERHHLRILAHCLACFKVMDNSSESGSLPNYQERMKWCMEQPKLSKDKPFISIFLNQLGTAGAQLEKIALDAGMMPLDLTLEDLIRESLKPQKSKESLS